MYFGNAQPIGWAFLVWREKTHFFSRCTTLAGQPLRHSVPRQKVKQVQHHRRKKLRQEIAKQDIS